MARYVLPLVALVLCSACDRAAVQKSAPVAEERFARGYLRSLRDSGPPAVLARTKPTTVALAGLPEALTQLRVVLANAPDSLLLRSWTVERDSNGPPVTQLVYDVPGQPTSLVIELWVEHTGSGLVAETIRLGQPRP